MNSQSAMDESRAVLTEQYALNIFKKYIEQDKQNVKVYDIAASLPVNCHPYSLAEQDCWFVICSYNQSQGLMLCSSRLVAISKATGEVVYDGSANDEG